MFRVCVRKTIYHQMQLLTKNVYKLYVCLTTPLLPWCTMLLRLCGHFDRRFPLSTMFPLSYGAFMLRVVVVF